MKDISPLIDVNCMRFRIGDLVTWTEVKNCYWRINEIIFVNKPTQFELQKDYVTTVNDVLLKVTVFELVEEFNRYKWEEGNAYLIDDYARRTIPYGLYPIRVIKP